MDILRVTADDHARLARWLEVYMPDQPVFAASFAEAELEQLHGFTDFFLARVEGLTNEFSELLKDPYWNVVCEFAGEILADFSTVSHET
ncbi:hypothetical protein [Thiothrix nivea]|uniref:Uncharacterized protein n=1 Tax=Thiothrix nivea (strain ATCC 35100 / DSM 5205 / JP2) TaxID=870187 RepID=A0A656HNK5_THINJ|nr:hypothetical protein [Thiothrix nivea]EIJ36930.1 hypothetical protein Thini_4452 [Thiothrix nivea DSM 5205]